MSENTAIEFTQPSPEEIKAHYDYVSAQKFQELHAAGLAGNSEPYRSDPTKENLLRKMLNEYAHDIGSLFHREVPKPPVVEETLPDVNAGNISGALAYREPATPAEPEIPAEHLTEPATPEEK